MDGYRLIQVLIVVDVSTRLLAVTLKSSADRVCPGDTVVFTCVTDTLPLIWTYNGFSKVYYSPNQINETNMTFFGGAFRIQLNTTDGFVSTAVATSISLNYDGTNITCSDSIDNKEREKIEQINIEPPPSPPLNLTFTLSPALSSVTISWVAPLDTPLCVHSYTVTVNNSCNSSQVMVYNTTDNRNSLSITNLTTSSACEYSVTVAGRDEAGRLGQKSEELRISSKSKTNCNISIMTEFFFLRFNLYGALVQWTYNLGNCIEATHIYLITHNVSLDPPITVNRTNVMLYGVQPGETYAVQITAIHTNSTALSSELSIFKVPDVVSTNCQLTQDVLTNCTHTSEAESTVSTLSWAIPMATVPLLVLIAVIICLLLASTCKVKLNKCLHRSKKSGNLNLKQTKPSDDVLKTTSKCYEEVGSTGEDNFAMMSNPSYSVPALK